MTLTFYGMLSLNVSFVLYLLVYFPQVRHNRTLAHIQSLSTGMHVLLFSGYILDLLYGFLSHYPWQYKMVSCVGVVLLLIQHMQLIHLFWKRRAFIRVGFYLLGLMFAIMGGAYVLLNTEVFVSDQIVFFGLFSRGFFLSYTVPQFLKNKALNSAVALSTSFVILSLAIACLDTISAWALDWGWPNKIGSPISILLTSCLLYQIKKYGLTPRAVSHFSAPGTIDTSGPYIL